MPWHCHVDRSNGYILIVHNSRNLHVHKIFIVQHMKFRIFMDHIEKVLHAFDCTICKQKFSLQGHSCHMQNYTCVHIENKNFNPSGADAVIIWFDLSLYYIWHCVDSAERDSHLIVTTDTPHLGLTGELWCVYCKDFGENWLYHTVFWRHMSVSCLGILYYQVISHGINCIGWLCDTSFW